MQNKDTESYFMDYPVGMCYVPWQILGPVYESLEIAFQEGTLFPELNKPFYGRGM